MLQLRRRRSVTDGSDCWCDHDAVQRSALLRQDGKLDRLASALSNFRRAVKEVSKTPKITEQMLVEGGGGHVSFF